MSSYSPEWPQRVFLVGLLFISAGCLAPVGTEIDNPQAVERQVESRYQTLDGFQATMIRTLEVENKTNVTRATVTFDKGDSLRIAYHTGPNAGESTLIADPSPGRLFGATRSETAGSDSADIYGSVAADIVESNDVEYRGSETVDSHSVAIFSIMPKHDQSGPANLTERKVWIDIDRSVPVKIHSEWTVNGRSVVETIRFENVSLGTPAADTSSVGGAAT